MTLLGKPMKIDGKLVDGLPLKWDDYRGKVVLVMFWATWCAPCRAELPEVKECYEAYHNPRLRGARHQLRQPTARISKASSRNTRSPGRPSSATIRSRPA